MRTPSNDNLKPITADDATIAAALEEASIPALVNTLVHLTGDLALLGCERNADNDFFGDPQGGIPPAEQARFKALALDALKRYRDQGCPRLPVPDRAAIQAMMNFLVGAQLPGDYVEFLESELALNGEDGYAFAPLLARPAAQRSNFNVVIIGAGMSGLLAAIRLAEAGIAYIVVDKNSDVGGTWFENVYPGCRVDSPNHTYSYSFAPNVWPQHFSQQAVLREYFAKCATEFGLREHIRFNTEVLSAAYDERGNTWAVQIRDGDGVTTTLRANALISAVGQLNRPKQPDIPGQERFTGVSFHSSRWQHQHDLRGKRIGVIGTGASAFQFVPEIARQAAQVTVFQRTPPWAAPSPTYHDDIPAGKHWLLNHVPFYGKWFRFLMFWRSSEGLLASVTRDPAWNDNERAVSEKNDQLRAMLTMYLQATIGDNQELVAKILPSYPPGGKRMLLDNGNWLNALTRDNVHVVTDPIAEVTPTGVLTQNGVAHDFDVIVYGTGFYTNRFLFPMKIVGRGGIELQAQWETDNPRAYLGITVPNFPNLFVLYGPNTNIVVNGSIVFFSECEMRYVLSCIDALIATGSAAMEPKPAVHDAYNREIDAGNQDMAWGAPTVQSWYKNSRGRVTQNWPFSLREYWQRTKQVNQADYEFS